MYFVFRRKFNLFSWKTLINFIKIGEILVKISEKGEWNQRNSLYFLESLNLDISLSKTKIKKIKKTEVEMELVPFLYYKDCISGVWVCTSCKFNQIGLKKLISCCFWWKVWFLWNF